MTLPSPTENNASEVDLAIVGGGAAGMTAAIWAARTNANRRIVVLDGAKRLGAKILIAGGGRCNVTHRQVNERDFNGGSKNAIRKVLGRFPQAETVAFFEELGVRLKVEPTGKLFPTTDKARTVLAALTEEMDRLHIPIRLNHRIEAIRKLEEVDQEPRFQLSGSWGHLVTQHVILATGGKSVPKTGSDGHGLELAKRLGHQLTPQIIPALAPLTLEPGHHLTQLAGVSFPGRLELRTPSGKRLQSVTGDILLTHHGLSGPAVLDISRHFLAEQPQQPVELSLAFLLEVSEATAEEAISGLGRQSIRSWLRKSLPERLADLIMESSKLPKDQTAVELTRVGRKQLIKNLFHFPLPIVGTPGFKVAEATAGGIPLTEIELRTMQSRVVPGLFLCGEICDVDGRIGGFNFQWAWSSGYVAGISA